MFSTMFSSEKRPLWATRDHVTLILFVEPVGAGNFLLRTCKCRLSNFVMFFLSFSCFCLPWNMGQFCGTHWQCFAGLGCVFSFACSRKSLWSECPSELSTSQIKRLVLAKLISFSLQRNNTVAVQTANTHVYIVLKTIHQTKRPVLDIPVKLCRKHNNV